MNPLFISLLSHSTGAKGADTILENDPMGFTVAVISVCVVLSALIVLALLVWGFSRIIIASSKKTSPCCAPNAAGDVECTCDDEEGISGETIAAIALAMRLHQADMHDRESEVITINSVARAYSPWSSKIHGLTNLPR